MALWSISNTGRVASAARARIADQITSATCRLVVNRLKCNVVTLLANFKAGSGKDLRFYNQKEGLTRSRRVRRAKLLSLPRMLASSSVSQRLCVNMPLKGLSLCLGYRFEDLLIGGGAPGVQNARNLL